MILSPGRVPLVAHCVREIRNRLPDALLGPVANSRTEYSELASAIHARWVEDGWPPDGVARPAAGAEPSSAGPIRPEVSPELLRAVGDLVVGHVAASENYRGRAGRVLEVVGGAAPPNYVVQAWVQGSKWAVKLAHVRTTPLPAEHEVDLASKFLVFEQALMVISNRSYENMDALDEILDAAGPQIVQVQTLSTRPENRAYFFDRLENPNWVDALHKAEFFTPPDPVPAGDGYVQFPPWPEGRYLARAAVLRACRRLGGSDHARPAGESDRHARPNGSSNGSP